MAAYFTSGGGGRILLHLSALPSQHLGLATASRLPAGRQGCAYWRNIAPAFESSQLLQEYKTDCHLAICFISAEAGGFEPPVPCGTPAFQAGALDHYATPPELRGLLCRAPLGNYRTTAHTTGRPPVTRAGLPAPEVSPSIPGPRPSPDRTGTRPTPALPERRQGSRRRRLP